MKRRICLLLDPYDPVDIGFLKKENSRDSYYLLSDNRPYDPNFENWAMLPNGDMRKINDYDKFMDSANQIIKLVIDDMRQKLEVDTFKNTDNIKETTLTKYLKQKMQERDEMGSKALEDPKQYKLDYLRISMQITSVYIIADNKLDDLKNSVEANEELIQTIIDERKEELKKEEEEAEIENELDMVNSLIKSTFPNNTEPIQIESCKYNNEDISPREITTKLSTHYLPQYITQVDITKTLNDTYEIVTNLGIIERSKGGNITIKKK